MKKSFFIAVMLLANYCTFAQTVSTASHCLSLTDAEKVLGQLSRLVESKSETKNGILQHNCTYTAIDADSKTGKRGNLYYSIKEYPSAEAARDTLAKFDRLNKNSPGWIHLAGIGDEAISHTDKANFQLFIVRKGNKMVLIKINKVTSFTVPLDTLLAVGQRISGTL